MQVRARFHDTRRGWVVVNGLSPDGVRTWYKTFERDGAVEVLVGEEPKKPRPYGKCLPCSGMRHEECSADTKQSILDCDCSIDGHPVVEPSE